MNDARLILDNGQVFHGRLFAKGLPSCGELIFNTAMCGYEEVLTDPSYKGQIVLMTYPLIGNYGINEEDKQSHHLHLDGLIVKEYIDFPSNWRSKQSLKSYLETHHIMGIEGIDTRTVTRQIRHLGAVKALITDSDEPDHVLIDQVKHAPGIIGKNLVKSVSTPHSYSWTSPKKPLYNVAVIDCGVKFNILHQLHACDCSVTVFPYHVSSHHILSGNFDGVLISNGPGDPSAVTETIDLVKQLVGRLPLFGICLGHQILCCAFGFNMMKLPFGHHGVNHPIKHLFTNRVEISSQNHIYCVEKDSIPDSFVISHINLNDQTVAGIRSDSHHAFSVQYHPESGPGPHDSHYLFDEFTHLMQHHQFKHPYKETVVEKG